MKTKKHKAYPEEYSVSLDYKKHDGMWVHNHTVCIRVDSSPENEKTNHRKAEMRARSMYPGCRVNSVSYV